MLHALLGIALVGLLLVILRAISAPLIPLLQAAFLTVILYRPVAWLRKSGIGQLPAVVIVAGMVALILILLAIFLTTSMVQIAGKLPAYQHRLNEMTQELTGVLNRLGIQVPVQQVGHILDPALVFQLAASVAQQLGLLIWSAVFITILVGFALLEVPNLGARLPAALGRARGSWSNVRQFATNLNQYLIIKTLIGMGTGCAAGTLVALIGLDHALLWGVLTFLLNYIPNIGSLAAVVPPALLAFLQLGPVSALLVVLAYGLVNVLFANILEPRFMGQELGFSPAIILVSIVVWGWVFGLTGVFLAVPLSMLLMFALRSREETKWVATLMSLPAENSAEAAAPKAAQSTE